MYYKNFGEFYKNQIIEAKCIILSHTKGIDEQKLDYCMDMIKELNPEAVVVTTDWDELTGEQILQAMTKDNTLANQLKELESDICPVCGKSHHHYHDHDDEHECGCEHHHHDHDDEHECGCEHHHHDHDDEHECGCEHHHHDHDDEHECGCGHHHHDHEDEHECGCEHHHHDHDDEHECGCGHHHHEHGHHHADEVFTSWGKETINKYSAEQIKSILSGLDSGEYGTILRAKGIVESVDGKWLHFDYVPEEADVRYGSSEVIGRICVIGCELKEDKLAQLFLIK